MSCNLPFSRNWTEVANGLENSEGTMLKVVTPRGTRCSRDPGAPARSTSHCNALQELILTGIFPRLVKGVAPFSMKSTMVHAIPDAIFSLGSDTFKRLGMPMHWNAFTLSLPLVLTISVAPFLRYSASRYPFIGRSS